MKTTYLFSALLVSLFLSKPCIAEEATGSDVRAVLDGKYALTSEVYAEYQKCVTGISLGESIKQYTSDIEKCKSAAKNEAYALTAEPGQENTPTQSLQDNPAMQMQRDRAWQNEKLKRFK